MNETDRKRPAAGFWIAVALVAMLVWSITASELRAGVLAGY